jgi:mono/diheme cytochrome c family protein
MRSGHFLCSITLLALAACGSNAVMRDAMTPDTVDSAAVPDAVADVPNDDPAAWLDGFVPPFFDATAIPTDPQRNGDPDAGYHALVNNGYVGCGIPYSAFARVFAPAGPGDTLPGRDGHNATLPYNLTSFRVASGVEVVNPNCLECHAGHINGQLVIGLGASDADFTTDTGILARLSGGLVTDPTEHTEWARWSERVQAVAPFIRTHTIGVNPADNIAAVLFAHRDRNTLAWSHAALMPLPPNDPVAIDVPPWWNMRKKNAMLYNGSGRGDHARIMMTASTLCTDSVADAQAIDAYFPDIEAYILSLRPPAYPFAIDRTRAAHGETVFNATCSRCHGTYGASESYPNLIVSLGEVGTDPVLGVGAGQFATRFVDWFNQSFYGQAAHLQPTQGYVAPPLDGVWATAPYLHNGSVPTVEALLNSRTRPQYWTRSFASTDYNQTALGWNFTALDHGQSTVTDANMRARIYDTTLYGHSNQGHTFGDGLSDADRSDLIEYLKTL